MMDRSAPTCSASTVQTIWPSMAVAAEASGPRQQQCRGDRAADSLAHKTARGSPGEPSIVFFEQPSIPVHPLQRRFLCDQIRELAAAWPNHPVIFKPRTSSIESTLHRRHGRWPA